jgi:hypothetical protein
LRLHRQRGARVRLRAARYCYSGRVDGPRQLHRGGYISWREPDTGDWWQRDFFGDAPRLHHIGKLALDGRNPRATIDRITRARKRALAARP